MRRTASFFLCAIFLLTACEEEYTPRPRGYYRIELPAKSYTDLQSACPFTFELPQYAIIANNPSQPIDSCWMNIHYQPFNATLHLSYKQVQNNLRDYLEDSRSLAMKHTVKANDIREIPVVRDSSKVYGLIYDIKGNAASSLQFYLTDSSSHFLRGSLYFNNAPNIDSVGPVLDFIRQDIERMVESFSWKTS